MKKQAKKVIKPLSADFVKINYYNSPYKKYIVVKR